MNEKVTVRECNDGMVRILKHHGFVDVSFTLSLGGSITIHHVDEMAILDPDNQDESGKWIGKYDTNNGVGVVWDLEGHPWVIRGYGSLLGPVADELDSHFLKMVGAFNGFNRGAFVPHSNDSGHMISALFPERNTKAPQGWFMVIEATSYWVTSPSAVQLLLIAKDLREAKNCSQDDYDLGGKLIKLAAALQDGKLHPKEAMVQAIAAAHEATR